MFPCTALGKPLLKIGTMLTKAVLFHFIQLGCVPIFMPIGDFSLFRLQRLRRRAGYLSDDRSCYISYACSLSWWNRIQPETMLKLVMLQIMENIQPQTCVDVGRITDAGWYLTSDYVAVSSVVDAGWHNVPDYVEFDRLQMLCDYQHKPILKLVMLQMLDDPCSPKLCWSYRCWMILYPRLCWSWLCEVCWWLDYILSQTQQKSVCYKCWMNDNLTQTMLKLVMTQMLNYIFPQTVLKLVELKMLDNILPMIMLKLIVLQMLDNWIISCPRIY
jgi:hypothetical protein